MCLFFGFLFSFYSAILTVRFFCFLCFCIIVQFISGFALYFFVIYLFTHTYMRLYIYIYIYIYIFMYMCMYNELSLNFDGGPGSKIE